MEQPNQVKYEGRPVKIGGREFVLPSLSVRQAEKWWPTLLELDQTGATVEEMKQAMSKKFSDIVGIVRDALSRNYPDVTEEWLKEEVSIGQIRELTLAVMGQSGFDAAGERKPVEPRPVVH